ncbi:hypothetical protein [Sulfuricurvum sp.]|uniref:hypothetical protein n=1 Tax=Sulfuricurvum sp. TaxID=2025608 RepID=UPI00261BE02C|nr:hypothetical protein [Sulfuricurvum sp.]MDD3597774.1 hypothetical protein [Sulfuricurvum sp.]
MFWNLFIRPKHRTSKKVDVCITTFEADDETFVRDLFYKRHVGLEILTTAYHPTREQAYKQIYDMGSIVQSHFEFWEKTMMCDACGLHSVGSMSDQHLCDFCHMEKEYENKFGSGKSDPS